MTDYIVITHTDLDGVVSGYLAGLHFGTNVVISSNYHEVTKKMKQAYEDYGKVNLVITDLNILPSDLQFALKHFNYVTIYDHHPSSEDFLPLEEISDKFTIYFNDKICATTLVEKDMILQGYEFSDKDKEFLRFVNLYDNWKVDHKDFIFGRMANDLFWYYGWTNFLYKLRDDGLPDIPEGLSHKELKHCRETYDNIAKAGREAEWYNTDCHSTIVILEEDQKIAINHISNYIDSQTGIFYIIYYSQGVFKCSVRVGASHRDNYRMGDHISNFLETCEVFETGGGHDNAGGMSSGKGRALAEILNEVERFDSFIFESMETT